MLWLILVFNLLLCPLVISKRKSKDSAGSDDDLGGNLISSLRNDANIDLSVDEDYEDLRAELLAYHTALASLTSSRRSMKTTPCWQLGGICVDHKMCEGHRSLSEVPGCKNKLEVCCFTWNSLHVRDMRDKGLGVLAMPWSEQKEIGGKGVLDPFNSHEKKHKKNHHENPNHENLYNENLYLERPHHEGPDHELPQHENPYKERPQYEKLHYKIPSYEGLHHERRQRDSSDHETLYVMNPNLKSLKKESNFMPLQHKKNKRSGPPLLIIIRS